MEFELGTLTPTEADALCTDLGLPDYGLDMLKSARVAELPCGTGAPLTDPPAILLSGQLTNGSRRLVAPAFVNLGDEMPWQVADGSARLALTDLEPFAEFCSRALEDGLDLPALGPSLRKRAILRSAVAHSNLFDGIAQEVAQKLCSVMTLGFYEAGKPILVEGAPSDSLYVVLAGRVAFTRDGPTGPILLGEAGAGTVLGEIGLLLDTPRTAHAYALRDAWLARLDRAAFEALMRQHPMELTRLFSRALFENLEGKHRKSRRPAAMTLMVVPDAETAQDRSGIMALKQGFDALGKTLMLEPGFCEPDELPEAIGRLEEEYAHLLILTSPEPDAFARRLARQVDQMVFVSAEGTTRSPESYRNVLQGLNPARAIGHCEVLLHAPGTERPREGARLATGRYPVRMERQADFDRVARYITGRAVGLVLGGGGARGMAHIGILRAMAELDMPIDVVGGNSAGALIGSQYAYGIAPEDLLASTFRLFKKGERPTLPIVSVMAGKGMDKGLREMFGETRIQDLWLPFFTVAASITKARVVTLDEGPLWRATRASNALAGILPPVPHRGELLVDCGVLNNTPVDVMRGYVGQGTVIGVCVDLREEIGVPFDLAALSPMATLRSRFGKDKVRLPGLGDILARTGTVGGIAARARVQPMADIWLEPPVSQFAMIAHYKAREIAEVGYRYAMETFEGMTLP